MWWRDEPQFFPLVTQASRHVLGVFHLYYVPSIRAWLKKSPVLSQFSLNKLWWWWCRFVLQSSIKTAFIKMLRFVIRWGKLWVFHSRKRGNSNFESVTAAQFCATNPVSYLLLSSYSPDRSYEVKLEHWFELEHRIIKGIIHLSPVGSCVMHWEQHCQCWHLGEGGAPVDWQLCSGIRGGAVWFWTGLPFMSLSIYLKHLVQLKMSQSIMPNVCATAQSSAILILI